MPWRGRSGEAGVPELVVCVADQRLAVPPLQPPHREVAARDAPEMREEGEVDRGAAGRPDDRRRLRRQLDADRRAEAGGDGGDEARQQAAADRALQGLGER
jgi:hypothetical protein